MKLWCTNVPSSRHGGHLSPNLEQVSWINLHVNLKRNENGQENVYEKLKIYIFFNFRKSKYYIEIFDFSKFHLYTCRYNLSLKNLICKDYNLTTIVDSLRQVTLLLYEACFLATLWDRFLCCYMRHVSLLLFEAGFFAAIWGRFPCYSLRPEQRNMPHIAAKKPASKSSKETCLI
jgi:hypothetical protein